MATQRRHSIFTDFLAELGVPHTAAYSDRQFERMTFRSLFGLSKLLQRYGVESEAYSIDDKSEFGSLTPPFLAGTRDSFVIVTADDGQTVTFRDGLTPGTRSMPRAEFIDRWTGVVLLAFPTASSTEPDMCSHTISEAGNRAKRPVFVAALVFIFLYLFIANGVCRHFTTVMLTLVDLAGIYVTYHLVLKSLNIHSKAADSICGIVDRSGCRTVLNTPASKFFGIFGWSELGLSYFTVSLVTLLVFPQYTGYLALINACCCLFSFWSIWYQKYRAKAWCTLCLLTQACLWLSFAFYVFGGWLGSAFPLGIQFFILCASYVAALLGLNAIMPALDKSDS